MRDVQSQVFLISMVCCGAFLFFVVILPVFRILPFLEASDGQKYFYDGVYSSGGSSDSERYAEFAPYPSDVSWAWLMLDDWKFSMLILAFLGTFMICFRQYQLTQGYPDIPWLNRFGFAVAVSGVIFEWFLFLIVLYGENWMNSTPASQPSLNFLLLAIHFGCILILLLGSNPGIVLSRNDSGNGGRKLILEEAR